MLAVLGVFFPLAALLGLLGLAYVATPDVPRITGTVALILTIAALGVAILH
ncbi:hypothetical protein [Streptomyces sp. Wh19]|uniref:hypothetical protein n=1 Tax=Streptomyces sp. Wh19 TaxID=3076629 RepID=UPI002958945C|nr:hypothetical protein [Streptomyces sp. Wh19]MDV9194332.1 hypothetical protein [Streptomyces sp. Wh19]